MFDVLGWMCVAACILLFVVWAGLELWEGIEKYVTRYRDLKSRVQEHQKCLEIYQEKLEELKRFSDYERTQKYHIWKSSYDEEAYELARARRDLASFWKRNRADFVIIAAITCAGFGCICGLIHCILNPKG